MFAMTANVAGLVQSRANPAARAGIDALGATALVALVAVVVFAALADARIVSALAARVTADIGSVRSRVCGCVATHRDDDARRGERSIERSIANTVVRSRVAEGCVRTVYPCAKAIDRPWAWAWMSTRVECQVPGHDRSFVFCACNPHHRGRDSRGTRVDDDVQRGWANVI